MSRQKFSPNFIRNYVLVFIWTALIATGVYAVPKKSVNKLSGPKLPPQHLPAPVQVSPLPPNPIASTPVPAPDKLKPEFETFLKPKSVKRVIEEFDIVTNSDWPTEDDFSFVNAVFVRTPLAFTRTKALDFSLYPKMSSAIKKCEFDAKTQILEVVGETHGLHMHSWVKVDQTYTDLIRYEIIRGDMVGFTVNVYFWNKQGKTLTLAKGLLPHAKQLLPKFVALIFKPVSEIVIGVATKNFRSYIEEEYTKQKSS